MHAATRPATQGALRALLIVATAVGLVGPATAASAPASSARAAATPAGPVEHETAQPRLVMIEPTTGTVVVVDVERGEVIAREPSAVSAVSPGEAPATTQDGRFTFFSHYSEHHVTIVDAGSWTEPHGTHVHHYATDPAVIAVLDGREPTHVVDHAGRVAVFYDGTGDVVSLDGAALADGRVEVIETFRAGGPHHGVAVPVDDCSLASLPVPGDPASLPASVGLFCDGDLRNTVAACADLHGEGTLGGSIVFACADGVTRVAQDATGWTATRVAYPRIDDDDMFGAAQARAWGFRGAAGNDHLIAWAGSRHLFLYDQGGTTPRIRPLELPAPLTVYGIAAVPASSEALVLTTDGMLQHVDLTSGTIVGSIQVVEPFEPDLSFVRPHHFVVATTDRAFVLDPPAGRIVEVHLGGTLRLGRTFELEAPATQLTLAPG